MTIRATTSPLHTYKLHPKQMEAVRARNMFSKLTLFYADDAEPGIDATHGDSKRGPLCLVRGAGQYVYDAEGHKYLDCVNNVRGVGDGGCSVGCGWTEP